MDRGGRPHVGTGVSATRTAAARSGRPREADRLEGSGGTVRRSEDRTRPAVAGRHYSLVRRHSSDGNATPDRQSDVRRSVCERRRHVRWRVWQGRRAAEAVLRAAGGECQPQPSAADATSEQRRVRTAAEHRHSLRRQLRRCREYGSTQRQGTVFRPAVG